MAFGAKAGCDARKLFEILAGSAGQSWMLEDRVPHMIESDYTPRSSVDIFVKDLGIVLDAGRAMRMGLPIAAAAHQNFLNASGAGYGKQDDSQVIKTYRMMNRDAQ